LAGWYESNQLIQVIYILAMPLYLFFLPLYRCIIFHCSFWHFDDFSWGSTRTLEAEEGVEMDKIDGEFNSEWVPKKTWEDYKVDDLEWRLGVN
jgi:chitin synthase